MSWTTERDVVLLIAYGGLGYDEVAAALRIASGTVASRLSRARISRGPSPGKSPAAT
ncbi:RNA polymerase sigma factor [Nonomuraea sp. NPDC003727]